MLWKHFLNAFANVYTQKDWKPGEFNFETEHHTSSSVWDLILAHKKHQLGRVTILASHLTLYFVFIFLTKPAHTKGQQEETRSCTNGYTSHITLQVLVIPSCLLLYNEGLGKGVVKEELDCKVI